MNWFRNFIIRLLRIEPAKNRRMVIKESASFQTNVLKNKILYRGDPAEIEQFFKAVARWDVEKTRFWASVSQGSVRKMHSGIVATVIDRYKDIVTADLDRIDFGEEGAFTPLKDIWDAIAKDNRFLHVLEQAITDTLITGDGAFKISIEAESNYPIIEFYDAENVEYTELHGRIKEIKFYTTYQVKFKEYRLQETYGIGYVKYKLFGEDGKEVDLSTLEETKGLCDITFNGKYIMAVPLKIFTSNKYRGRGKALFEGKTDVIDALDEVISQWLDAVRLGRIKRYIPDSLIPRDPVTGMFMPANPFDNDFIAIGDSMSEDGKAQIDISQPQISYEAYVSSYTNFLDMVLQGIISPSTLGIDLKKTDNAESQREKEKVTLHVRNKIVDALTETIPELVDVVMKTYDLMCGRTAGEYKATVKFGEYASPDFNSTVETVGKAKQYGIMSIETSVEQLYGDTWKDEEKRAEVVRLKEENGITTVEEPALNTDGVIIEDEENQKAAQNPTGGQSPIKRRADTISNDSNSDD